MVDDPKDPRNRIGRISAAYNLAASDKEKPAAPAAPERRESDQVKNSAPGMHLTPKGSMREGPDRQKYNQALAKDMADAIKNRDSQKGRDKEPER